MAELRRSLRRRATVNYQQLTKGPRLPTEKERQSKAWSTTKLYPLEITDTKVVGDKLMVKVHYVEKEWVSHIYDEWRDAEEIVTVPDSFVNYTAETRELFLKRLGITIKESLHGQRKVDSAVKLRVDISKNLFEDLFLDKNLPPQTGRIRLHSFDQWNSYLGKNWNVRILNCNGDFAYVMPGTLWYCLSDKKPLEEYSLDGGLRLIHRGYLFTLQFVKGLGSKSDFHAIEF